MANSSADQKKTSVDNKEPVDDKKPPSVDDEAFPEWFWKSKKGNNLIRRLNAYAQKKKMEDRIRREKEGPYVYAIVLNDDKFPFEADGHQWKLVKVGFTHRSIKKGDNNRMKQLKQKIESKYNEKMKKEGEKPAEASILFALRIGSVDSTPFNVTEARIRGKVGTPVHKAKATELNLPVPTEWVLTTQKHIDDICDKKDEMKKKIKDDDGKSGEGAPDLIDIFKGTEINQPPTVPKKYQQWVSPSE